MSQLRSRQVLRHGNFTFIEWPQPQSFSRTFSHVYLDDNPTATPADTLTLTGIDDDTRSSQITVDLPVVNAPPVVLITAIVPIDRDRKCTVLVAFAFWMMHAR